MEQEAGVMLGDPHSCGERDGAWKGSEGRSCDSALERDRGAPAS